MCDAKRSISRRVLRGIWQKCRKRLLQRHAIPTHFSLILQRFFAGTHLAHYCRESGLARRDQCVRDAVRKIDRNEQRENFFIFTYSRHRRRPDPGWDQ
jgi:hypothetical protein